MAIEPMKTVWLFDPQARERELLNRLAAMGLSHVSDCGLPAAEEAAALGIQRVYPETAEIERRVQMMRDTLETLAAFSKTSRDFLQNFIPTPIEVSAVEVRRSVAELNVEELHASVRKLEKKHADLRAALEKALERRKSLLPLRQFGLRVPGTRSQKWTAAWLGLIPAAQFDRLRKDGRLQEAWAISEAARLGRRVVLEVACPAAEREVALALLREYGFEPVEPAEETLTVERLVARLDEEIALVEGQIETVRAELRRTAEECRRRLEVALGYWEERLRIAYAAAMLARSKRLTALKAFVRARDMARFRQLVAQQLPDVVLLEMDPKPGESVPVSLKNPRFFAPAQFLVNMFGLPEYFTFDPTPVILFSFLLFFGFCFGDVLYGLLLIACGLALARKYREYPNLRHFFQLLTYGGVPTVVVGALTGAWAGDLPKYLGEDNLLARISERLKVADPVDRALVIMLIALGIGMVNQFIGIIMSMVRNVRRGDPKAAVFDGAFWLLLLPGFVILASGMFVKTPAWLTKLAWALSGAGALGLVLTQGRAEKSYIGKVIVGVVSLYGIVGSYGITAFIGDTLSYSRLLALGLTTGIVAMSFNMIADMARAIPALGLPIFALILLVGHGLNFILSILGGFVHSARLTFVEFFGRFYQGGAPRFTPLGTWQGRIRVTDEATVWAE